MRKILIACVALTALLSASAMACSITPPEPPLPNESDEAYKVRIETQEKERAERWAKERQQSALEQADLIFIARNRDWYPPAPKPKPQPKARAGHLPPPPVPIKPALFDPNILRYYFKPVAWFRGAEVTELFQVQSYMTNCGGHSGLGDTVYSDPGDVFLFFAHKTPLTRDTIIDAIALDKIDNPALVDFVSAYRVKK